MDIEKSIRENQLGAKLHIGKVLGGVDTIEKSVTEDIIKGKPAVAGEIREWSGKKYKKQPNGKWVEVSDEGKTKLQHRREASYYSQPERNDVREQKKHEAKSDNLSDKEHDEEELGGGKQEEKVLEIINNSKDKEAFKSDLLKIVNQSVLDKMNNDGLIRRMGIMGVDKYYATKKK